MGKTAKPSFPIKDDADRAMVQIHCAVGQLIEIAGGHPDPEVATKAANDLNRPRNLTTAPLREANDRFPAEERRMMLVALLGCVAPMPDMATVIWLSEVQATEPSERVREVALKALGLMHQQIREQREARAAQEVGGPKARAGRSEAVAG